jgi:hypothetical protein
MTHVSGVLFTIALMVKEAIILKGFSQIDKGSFPNPFFSGVMQGVQGSMRCAKRHITQEQHMGDLPINTLDTNKWSNVASSTFEFIHN